MRCAVISTIVLLASGAMAGPVRELPLQRGFSGTARHCAQTDLPKPCPQTDISDILT